MAQPRRRLVTIIISFLTVAYGQDSIPLDQDGDHVCTETQSFQDRRTISMTTEYETRYYTQCGLFGVCSRLRIATRVSYAQQFYTNYREVSVCCNGYIQSDNSCTACCSDTWGPDCANQCLCENEGVCNRTNGECDCPSGYSGANCETPCPAGQYGPQCALSCDCPGSCDPVEGTCICDAGFQGPRCTDTCSAGTYGQGCASLCEDCHNGGFCDHMTGICICQGGYVGFSCDTLALSLCNCSNGGQCAEDRTCLCQSGFEGKWCEQRAPRGFHGYLRLGHSIVTTPLVHLSQQLGDFAVYIRQSILGHHVERREVTNDTSANQSVLIIQDCPEHLIIIADLNVTEVPVYWDEPTAFSSNGHVTIILRTHAPGSFFPMDSEETVTYIFEDPAGISDKCEFVVQVTGEIMSPIVTGCPEDFTVQRELGSGNNTVSWNEPTTAEGELSITRLQSHSPGSSLPTGVTLVNYTFIDSLGNSDSCIFNVTVIEVDTTPPRLLFCPSNITRTVELGMEPLAVSWTQPNADDLSGEVFQSHSHTPNDTFPIGDTMVQYMFVDLAGNQVTCTFTVSIEGVDTTPPQIVGCPGNQHAVLEVGTDSGVVVNWTQPSVTDNSGAEVMVLPSSHSPGDKFAPGNTSVTTLYIDNEGNAAICDFLVTVSLVDTVAPVILSCPPNQTRTVELGTDGVTVEWTDPAVYDASGAATLQSANFSSGDTFIIGLSSVVYVFSDASKNEATCQFFVNVLTVDTTGPTILDCPSSITETVELGTTNLEVTWNAPSATDLSVPAPTVNSSHTPPAVFTVGAHTVRYWFTDAVGNVAECAFNVIVITVCRSRTTEVTAQQRLQSDDGCRSVDSRKYSQLDTTGPDILDCPSSISEIVELGTASKEVTWSVPSATDLSGLVMTVNASHVPPAAFTVGTHTVSYQFEDTAGNQAVCSFNIIITTVDTTAPTISNCPGNLSVTTELGTLSSAVTWVIPTATDASNVIIEEHSHFSGEIFPLGITTVNITFMDGSRNAAVCSFYVNLTTVDTTPPTIENCPSVTITEQVELGVMGAVVEWEEVVAVDLSPTTNLFGTHTSGDTFPVGETAVLIVFADSYGLQAVCTFKVQVIAVDTSPPVISDCPLQPINKTIELNETSTEVYWVEPSATDFSGMTEIIFQTYQPGSMFPIGVTIVNYIFSDSAQNSAICTFEVHVIQLDTQPPKILDCPEDILKTIEVGQSTPVLINWQEPTAVDLSGAVFFHQTHHPPALFQIGETVVTYTFMDTAGITNQCTFTVTVEQVDTMSPVISGCPEDIYQELEDGTSLSLPIHWVEPTATDNSGVPPTLSHRSFAPNDMFSAGNRTVVYQFTDMAGNRAECHFEVVVTVVDTRPPLVIFCPDDIEAPPVELGVISTTVVWTREPMAVDLSGGEVTLVFKTHQPGDIFFLGVTLVEYRFRDASFNEATCAFTVTVIDVDTTPPVIYNCPSDIIETVELGTQGLPLTWVEPSAMDLSQSVMLVSQTHSLGHSFLVGQAAVTYVFRDASGNEAECTFNVIVNTVDTTAPVVVSCPSDIVITIPRGSAWTVVSWDRPHAVDLSGPVNIDSNSADPGSIFLIGVTTVTYIFSDQSMNRAMCRFMVTVQTDGPDNIVISGCPEDFEVSTKPGTTIAVTWGEPTATNQAGTAFRQSRSHAPPVSLTAGSTEVVYTFADNMNNQASCRFTITVVEVNDLICPGTNITSVVASNSSEVFVDWTSSMITNDQGSAEIISPHTSGSLFPIGTTNVSYFINAEDGRTIECVLFVVVLDQTPPVVSSCPTDISIGPSNSALAVIWPEPSAADNSGNITTMQNFQSGDTFKSGIHVVSYSFTDPSGNVANCSFRIVLTKPKGDTPPSNDSLSSDALFTIIASSSLILFAVLIVAICLMSVCCCRSRSKSLTRHVNEFEDNYFDDEYFANGIAASPDLYLNKGYDGDGEAKYDEPPSTNGSIKKRDSTGSRRTSHYSQTLPLRPIQDPLDEGTRTIKRAYNGPVPGVSSTLPKQKGNHPMLEVQEIDAPEHCFPPIPEELDNGDYLEIK